MKKVFSILLFCFLFTIIVGCDVSSNKQYTITFYSNGGQDVSSISQDYNTQVIKPDDPIKEGFSFDGWYIDSDLTTLYEFKTMPKENIYLYAKWTIDRYTIIFNSNGGQEVLSITQNYNTQLTKPENPIKEGFSFGGWYIDSDLTTVYDFKTMPNENITLYAKWTIDQYTITFSSNGGTEVSAITQDYNTQIIKPDDPVKTGFTFGGWYIDSDLTSFYEFITMSNENITLYAKWTIEQYTITFNSNGGSEVSSITQDYNTQATKPDDPVKTGSIFEGWYLDSDLTSVYDFKTIPNENINLYAKWLKISPEGLIYSTLGDNTCSVIGYNGSDINIVIPNVYDGCTVTAIDSLAFYGVINLTSITIPSSVTTIEDHTFFDCRKLIIFAEANSEPSTWSSNWNFTKRPVYWGINSSNITEIDGIQYVLKDGNAIVIRYIGNENILFIPEIITINDKTYNVTSIGNYAFENCSGLTSITIPEGVTGIGDSAFWKCYGLTNITLPSTITSIGDSAFEDCTGLTNITIPEGVTSIGTSVFKNCTSLTSITIPNSVTTIGSYAFYRATNLESISIPESVSSIEDHAFQDCTSLTSVTIPNSVTTIGSYSFSGAKKLETVTIPNSVTIIGDYAFYECYNLRNIIIPGSVTSIGNHAFENCTRLTNITLSEGLTSIGNYAFSDCYSLKDIKIPKSVTSIGSRSFLNSISLVSIIIPSGVESIGDYAFDNCRNLVIYAEATNRPSNWRSNWNDIAYVFWYSETQPINLGDYWYYSNGVVTEW